MEFVIDQEIKYVNLCQHPINVLPPSGDEAEMLIVPPERYCRSVRKHGNRAPHHWKV